MTMHFIDLQEQYRRYQLEIDQALRDVLQSSRYINGPQIQELEEKLARFVGVEHAIAISSGTDGLTAVLMAWNIGPGDEVITTPFTFIASAEVIFSLGARPVFVDIDPRTMNLDPNRLKAAVTSRTRAIMPVSLYGQCADFDAINAVADHYGLPCLEDGCQSFGATYKERGSCGLSTAGVTSFFPSKPLGCYGDGGMIFTRDAELANRVRAIREHGQTGRYQHESAGFNGRLDTLQAAVLLAKFPHFASEIQARQRVAEVYRNRLDGSVVALPVILPENKSVFAQYTVRIVRRDAVRAALNKVGIPTAVHYPKPLYHQPVFSHFGCQPEDFPETERASREVLSLPMHPFLASSQQDQIVQELLKACDML